MTSAELDELIDKAVAAGGDREALNALKERHLAAFGGDMAKMLAQWEFEENCDRLSAWLNGYEGGGTFNFWPRWLR